MKNRILTLSAVIGVAVLFYLSVSAFKNITEKPAKENAVETAPSARDTFTNCIFNASLNDAYKWHLGETLHVAKNLGRYNELNFNAVHSYDESGTDRYGRVNVPQLTETQIDNYIKFLDSVKNAGNLYGFFERSFISKYCYGQRLIYEVAQENGNKTLNYGFVYQTRERGNYETDSGRTVVHAIPAADSTGGYLCKDIYENIQHSDLFGFRQSDIGKWFIKPVMRIPDSMPPTKKVVRIDIISFNGTPVDSIIITAANFNNNGIYNGEYIEKYFDLTFPHNLQISGDTNSGHLNYGKGSEDDWQDWDVNCKVDFRVFWYGKCEVWFDKMIVDDEVANDLFDPAKQIAIINPRINQEAENFTNHGGLYTFFTDEVFISQYPCIEYVVKKMRENNPVPRFSLALTRGGNMYGMKIDSNGFRVLLDSIKPDFVQDDHHGFQSYLQKLPATITLSDNKVPQVWIASSNSEYNQALQYHTLGCKTDAQVNNSAGSLLSELVSVKSNVSSHLPSAKFIMQPQIHGWLWYKYDEGKYTGGSREPTNEEIQVQAMLSIAHGADGLCWFIYNSRIDSNYTTHQPGFYTIGMLDPVDGYSNRDSNCYGQDKWTYVSQMNAKINSWLPVLENANWDDGFSVHQEGANYYYINDIKSKAPLIQGANSECLNEGLYEYYDCPEHKYWELGFFTPKDASDIAKYFVAVNRRCVPETETVPGDVRALKIKFDSPVSGNWVISDVNTGQEIVFDAGNPGPGGYLNLGEDSTDIGYFKPGEGKLFRLAPVTYDGGTLVSNETISGNVTCNGKIYNNGYNITINEGAVITFSDTAGIEMNGGTLTCGVNADNVDAVTLQKTTNGSGWNGLVLNNCQNIGIYNTNFSGIKANDTAKAVLISNCGSVYFRKSNFTPSNNARAIQTVYTNPSFDSLSFRVQECNFYMGQSGYSGISIISNASMTVPIVIEWCTFNTSNDTSNAILMNNITGGAIKNNVITNFSKSIIASSSVIDIYRNTIIGNSGSYGLRCLAGSDLKLKTVSGYYLGGENYIRNYGTSSSCIYSDNSLFDINNGENHFDLNDTVDSKFLTGTLGGVPSDNVDAAKNCFHLDSVNNIEANHTMTWHGTSDPVSFTFIAYNCELTQPQDFMVFNYGGYNDTVYYNPGGEGSGFNPNKAVNMQEGNYRSLRDTINLNLRKRNYVVVEDKAKQLLTQYPDSLESIGMVQKLYIASLTLDQNGNKIGQLKTYLENLISSNSQNPGLTKRAFYHIQKCKVKLGQYQSALEGFQYIMTQNPYSYEGLVASWDYAATYLLMGQGGSLSGDTEKMTEELNTPADTLLNRMSRNDSKTKSGSDGQKTKIFYEKVKTAAKDDRTRQEEKVKQLEKTIETSRSDATKTQAKTELTTMKTIKESVKIRKPNSVRTHITIVNSDIKKIFGIGKSTSSNTQNNLIPTSFELHQNYPNPFNPSTKIAFDLPKDAKVKLVIYDILGREIKTLIHNEFRAAGKYITEFNGSNLASGVYFYQLTINNEQLAIKKMLLIK